MEKKIRYSHQREAIYSYLVANKAHPTAETIYTALREQIPDLSLGTVYRNLKLLEDMGKVRRISILQGSDRYDAVCCDHVHFICQNCGELQDLEGIDPQQLLNDLPVDHRYQPFHLDLTLTGLCPRCTQSVPN